MTLIAYVCEGGPGLGWGHLGRARALADYAPGRVELLVGGGFDECLAHQHRGDFPYPLRRWHDASRPIRDPRHYGCVIVDHYTVSDPWLRETRERVPTIVVDDWVRTRFVADALLNQNIGARAEDYPEARVVRLLLGMDYVLLRREVLATAAAMPRRLPPADDARPAHLVLTLGGSDPHGLTARIASLLTEDPWYERGGRLTVVLGQSYAGPTPWRDWNAGRAARVDVRQHPPDFLALCASADVAIAGAGTTTYELAYLGTPFVPIAFVDNQVGISRGWETRGVGAGITTTDASWLTRLRETVLPLLDSGAARARAAERLCGAVDGHGPSRVLAVCQALAEEAVRDERPAVAQ